MQTTITPTNYKKQTVLSAYNIVWFIAHLFIALFFYTALSKLLNHDKFLGTISRVTIMKPYALFLSYAVPLVELAICVPLLFNQIRVGTTTIQARKIGLIAGGVLMLLFTIYIGVMLSMYGKNLPCSCGGFIKELSWQAHILFNLSFVGLSVWALLLLKRLNKR